MGFTFNILIINLTYILWCLRGGCELKITFTVPTKEVLVTPVSTMIIVKILIKPTNEFG
jgi:hypothetical protein